MGGGRGPARPGRRRVPAGLRHIRRRAGHHALRRPEAAGGARARPRCPAPDPRPRRRAQRGRHLHGGGDPEGAEDGPRRLHHLPRLPPHLHREGRGPHRGAARRHHRGARDPRRAGGPPRLLRRPAPPAAPGGRSGADGVSTAAAAFTEDLVAKSYDRTLLRRLLTYLRPYTAAVAVSFLLVVVMAALDRVGPYLTKIAIDRHITRGDASGLAGVAALYMLTLLAAFAVRYGQVYILQMTGQKVMLDMRRQIFGHLQRLHVGFFDRHPVGRLMTRVTTDVDAVNELFTSGVVTVFGDLFTLLGIMGVMMAMNLKLALVTFS